MFCVLMVECMSVVVNVMLSLKSVMSPRSTEGACSMAVPAMSTRPRNAFHTF